MISNLKVAVVGSIMVLPWSVALSSGAHADTFPSKVVRIVVPFAAGGTADITARKLGDVLSRKWGQPVIIENKAGASSMVGGLAVARAPADGYTILQSSDPLLSISHLMAKRPQLNPFTDFTPITTLIRLPLAVAVGASEPVQNLQELAALAKTKPLNYGTFGPGTAPHLATELFMSLASIDMTQISYRGTAPILLALTTGEIQVLVISPGSLLPTAQGQDSCGRWAEALLPDTRCPDLCGSRICQDARAELVGLRGPCEHPEKRRGQAQPRHQ